MEYTSINIQGNILSTEILQKIRQGEMQYQKDTDFGLKPGELRDEIAAAWTLVRTNYREFKRREERWSNSERGTTDTRAHWMIPFFNILGYALNYEAKAYVHPDTGKSYPVSHSSLVAKGIPVHIVSSRDSLDTADSGTRVSPHSLLQEYLNVTDNSYGLLTNGRVIRLLRDATRLVRLSFVEFDLEKMMDEDRYADFILLYRLLHVTRMPKQPDQVAESPIEIYYLDSIASGSRIREKLSEAVEDSIKRLANGFLNHPDNEVLRQKIADRSIDEPLFFLQQLRLIYRLLFLIVLEERRLVYPAERDEETDRLRDIYFSYYSIERLRKMAAENIFTEANKYDLYEGVRATFRLFENNFYGAKLGIHALGSGLFDESAIHHIVDCRLDNETMITVIRNLCFFENDQHQRVRVNYSDLDVEEFGSVYEGLLEYHPELLPNETGGYTFAFTVGSERSKSGSHYTPEALVKPLIDHSLEYQIQDKLKRSDPEQALLSLRVCDISCGSGHILLSAARRIALELARVRTQSDQPSPKAIRQATRDVIRRCIYGVDKNPLAVELCKVAFWLEAHSPGEPLNFLDHHIKCGDAVVGVASLDELKQGIADEAFKAQPGDDKLIASAYLKRNKADKKLDMASLFNTNNEKVLESILFKLNEIDQMPEDSPEQVAAKEKAYSVATHSPEFQNLRSLADLKVAQFFIPKTTIGKPGLITQADFLALLKGDMKLTTEQILTLLPFVQDNRYFHWFLEFPEIFANGGFDCILGNPPFLGGSKISGAISTTYLNYLKYEYFPAGGTADFVTYFFRRAYNLLCKGGFQSLISTNTIAQGGSREGGLDVIIALGGTINHAVPSMKWPGVAAVDVALVTIHKGEWQGACVLRGKRVKYITPYLDDSDVAGNPFPLLANKSKSFNGSKVYGKGFVLSKNEAQALIDKDPRNKDVLFPYLSGDDLNSNYDQSPSRWIVNFFDWDQKKASSYIDVFQIITERVKPVREKESNKNLRDFWWQYEGRRIELYQTIERMERVIVIPRISKYLTPALLPNGIIYCDLTVVIAFERIELFAILKSTFFSEWAWKNSSTFGSNTIVFSSTKTFETFPFPVIQKNIESLIQIGENYEKNRQKILIRNNLGLTKLYNQFHNPQLREATAEELALDNKKFEKQKGKETLALRNHFQKMGKLELFNNACTDITELRKLHVAIDQAVLEAYGWSDIALRHDFYEVDYLSENDNIRYTIHPEARREVLKRLLMLNHKLHADEMAAAQLEAQSKESKKTTTKKKQKDKKQSGPTLF